MSAHLIHKIIGNMTTSPNRRANKSYFVLPLFIAFFLLTRPSFAQKTGEALFVENCSVCHTTTDQKIVGPGLGSINFKRSQEWLIKWIRNSQELIASGDAEAIAVFEENNKMPMINYTQFSDEEIISILDYIKEVGSVATTTEVADAEDTSSTDADTTMTSAEGSGSKLETLDYVMIALVVALVGIFMWMLSLRKKLAEELGYTPRLLEKRQGLALVVMLMTAAVVVYFLRMWLLSATGMINTLMFMIFPYVAILIFLLGSIIRYRSAGFKVSSLSSQFLEGKKLFWGSQPFHLGLLVLFFGHLIAFLFPSSILAWNGSPVRLLILEGSSFVFALSALFGLVMLIRRRLGSDKLLAISNHMDMLVYTVLLVQILSGMGVAYYVRWGSSWFATVLSPYLSSIFALKPDIGAVSALPWLIQIHIFSAFFIIAIIPFTRFMHFLVAPVDYLWRSYQVVIWNWNKKSIRNSTKHTFGRKINNH
ncbi:MAG: respiratory nitrate reductase subunit gamma [Cytophagales bacterium]|nr:respiratory nitrate reductase subunit gamma [Cytophagales bacterium]